MEVVPSSAKNNVAHLKAGDTDVYLLGVSHVSKVTLTILSRVVARASRHYPVSLSDPAGG